MITKKFLDDLTYEVIGAAIEVHKAIGPGLLEEVYEEFMRRELDLRSIRYWRNAIVPVEFKGIEMETKLYCDLFVEGCLVVEEWALAALLPIHTAQMMTFMKLLKAPKGMLLNFNCANMFREGQKTFVNEYFRTLPEN